MVSVDVFGQQLMRYGVSQRGPPGVGFKLTADGQYDLETRRLCFVANPERPTDAATLQSVQEIVREAFTTINRQLNDLSVEIHTLEAKLQNFELELKRLEEDKNSVYNLVLQTANLNVNLDARLQTLERNEYQRNNRERAA